MLELATNFRVATVHRWARPKRWVNLSPRQAILRRSRRRFRRQHRGRSRKHISRGTSWERPRLPRGRARLSAPLAPTHAALAHAERPRVARARVRRPVELRRRAVGVADDLERLAALAAGDRPEAVAVHALEDGRRPPLRSSGPVRLEAAVAP